MTDWYNEIPYRTPTSEMGSLTISLGNVKTKAATCMIAWEFTRIASSQHSLIMTRVAPNQVTERGEWFWMHESSPDNAPVHPGVYKVDNLSACVVLPQQWRREEHGSPDENIPHISSSFRWVVIRWIFLQEKYLLLWSRQEKTHKIWII